MSTHLGTGLRSAIDDGSQASPFTSADLRGRIRRRRAVRTGTRAAVGIGAAGAVAFGVAQGDGPRATPASSAVTGAPAECGTDVEAFAAAHPDWSLALVLGHGEPAAPPLPTDNVATAPGPSLGRVVADTLVVTVSRHSTAGDDAREGAAMRLLLARDGRVVAWAQSTARGDDGAEWSGPGLGRSGTAYAQVTAPIETCDGSAALPAGGYDLYVGLEPASVRAPVDRVAGPWTLDLVPPDDTAGDAAVG